MITIEELKELCTPKDNNKAYYRPLICNGNLNKSYIFFVGTNPATPIYPRDLSLDSYVNLLLNYDKFISFYKEHRVSQGKTEFSRTRIGMNSFLQWLSQNTDSPIVETEVIPYPTDKLKALWKEPPYIIEEGKNIFIGLVLRFTPRLIILHGKETVEQAFDTFHRNGILLDKRVNLEQPIEILEKQMPICTLTYPNGKRGIVMACRHFMYYGSKGDSFKDFRSNLLSLLEKH